MESNNNNGGTPAAPLAAPAPTPANETKLTPEQELVLETARAETLKLKAEVLRAEADLRAEQELHSSLKRKDAIDAAFASVGAVKFHDRDTTLQILEAKGLLKSDSDGNPQGFVDGKPVTLHELLVHVATGPLNYLVDSRTTKHLQAPTKEEPLKKSRAEYSREEAVSFIDKFGLEAWQKLSTYPMQTKEIKSLQDFARLPQEAKLQFIEKYGAEAIGKLPSLTRKY